MPDATTTTITEEQKRNHDQLFWKNHVLGPRGTNTLSSIRTAKMSPSHTDVLSTPRNGTFNDITDSSFENHASLTPITHTDVANNPKTPHLREEFKRKQLSGEDADRSFSPALTATTGKKLLNFSTPADKSKASKSSLHRSAMTNNMLSNPSASSSSSDLVHISEETPSHVNVQKGPFSVLKKNRNINYDTETSRALIDKRPDLSSALNENGELNPLKAGKKVVMSPHKEFIPNWKDVSRTAKFSSPLTDSIEGRSKRGVKSPYTRGSPRKLKRESSKLSNGDWIDDDEGDRSSKKNTKRPKKDGKKSTWKMVIESLIDPQLPYILSLYLQLLFNVAIVSILLYFVYTFISTVRADVENKVDSYATDIIQEIALCSREYARNNCQPGRRVVALEAACAEWERCMNRDPATVGRAKIGAETFAEIINGFMKPISWKSMFFLVLITVGSLTLTNAAFGTYRNYNGQPNQGGQFHQQQQVPQTPGLPQTPHQSPYKSLQMNPQYTRYYTPKLLSPTSGAVVRHRTKSAKKAKR